VPSSPRTTVRRISGQCTMRNYNLWRGVFGSVCPSPPPPPPPSGAGRPVGVSSLSRQQLCCDNIAGTNTCSNDLRSLRSPPPRPAAGGVRRRAGAQQDSKHPAPPRPQPVANSAIGPRRRCTATCFVSCPLPTRASFNSHTAAPPPATGRGTRRSPVPRPGRPRRVLSGEAFAPPLPRVREHTAPGVFPADRAGKGGGEKRGAILVHQSPTAVGGAGARFVT